MKPLLHICLLSLLMLVMMTSINSSHAAGDDGKSTEVEQTVAQVIQPLMDHFGIPGMAVGITMEGRRYVFNYGVASRATGKPVDDHTLFEVGSISKTFTATLASYAQVRGKLSLSDHVDQYLPVLKDSSFGSEMSLLNLGTHTTGGLPLQVPDEVTNDEQLMQYFRNWKPMHPPGTSRTYSNPGIGLLGVIAAKSLNADFVALMEGKLFPAFGLSSTYLDVPAARMNDYAQGYTDMDTPIRLARGVLGAQAYGVRTTASDLIRFISANMREIKLDKQWQRAIMDTHTGYYRVGAMTQDLIWEQYPYPVALKDLLEGNSANAKVNPVDALNPPLLPRDEVLINKTGSTNGFSAYVAFVPARKIGIVVLANKRYPIDARVMAAAEILVRVLGGALSAQ